MATGTGHPDTALTEETVGSIVEAGTKASLYEKKRVLVLTPDATRTCPLPMLVRAIREVIGSRAARLDFMVALGTHPPLAEEAILKLYGISTRRKHEALFFPLAGRGGYLSGDHRLQEHTHAPVDPSGHGKDRGSGSLPGQGVTPENRLCGFFAGDPAETLNLASRSASTEHD
jgi:hypothetical protein